MAKKEILYEYRESEENTFPETEKDAFVLDMIAQIRTMTEVPETFEGLFILIVNYCLFAK